MERNFIGEIRKREYTLEPSLCQNQGDAQYRDHYLNGVTFGTIYVSFWNSSDSWQIEAEMTGTTDTADIEEEESLDMGGISM